jgi:hypothetical protein
MVLSAAVAANPGKPVAGAVWGAALGRHGDVVNSFRGQRGGVVHRGGCSTVVGGQPKERRREAFLGPGRSSALV